MSHNQKTLRIASELGDMVVHPMDRLGDVPHDGPHVDTRQESIVGGDEYESFVHKCLRLDLDICFIAGLPTSSMNPEHDRQVFGIRRRIDIEPLALLALGQHKGCCA